jgi:hypothetical protein
LPSDAGFVIDGTQVAFNHDLQHSQLQLSARSAKAHDLARRDHRSIADVVERALDRKIAMII